MKRFFLLVLIALFILPMTPVMAQSEVELPETFVADDFAFDHPEGWRVVEGSFGWDVIIPASERVISSMSVTITYLAFFDDPVEALEVYQDIYEDAELTEFESAGRPAASLVEQGFLNVSFHAVDFGNGLLLFSTIGSAGEYRIIEPMILAMLDSVRVPGDDDVVAEVELAEAIPLDSTYEDANLTFNHPEDWFTSSYQGRVALSNVSARAQYREPEFINVNTGEIVIIVYPNIDLLPGIVQRLIDEDTAYEVAFVMSIALSVEGGSEGMLNVDETEINGVDAAVFRQFSEEEDYYITALELGEDVVTVVAVVQGQELPDFEATINAIIESIEVQ